MILEQKQNVCTYLYWKGHIRLLVPHNMGEWKTYIGHLENVFTSVWTTHMTEQTYEVLRAEQFSVSILDWFWQDLANDMRNCIYHVTILKLYKFSLNILKQAVWFSFCTAFASKKNWQNHVNVQPVPPTTTLFNKRH